MFNIVLIEPEIPQNTGNIVRTCSATSCKLHLIKPLGFNVDEKSVRRAGLDYWNDVDISYYDNYSDFLNKNPDAKIYYSTTKANKNHSQVNYCENDFIAFGKETKGIPEEILRDNIENCIRIPMIENKRSLNLANSVSIVIYEAFRQNNFKGLTNTGFLK